MHKKKHFEKIGLLSSVSIGVTSIIGSGWLFSAYYAAKYAGSISFLSWIIGALLSLFLALMLAEIATLYPIRGLMARLFSISHNKDFGFIIATCNLLGILFVIPSEAQATVQYFSLAYPNIKYLIFYNDSFTYMGMGIVFALIFIYGIINYWGIKYSAKVTNSLSFIKVIIPIATAFILIYLSFNPSNFVSYKNTFAPYGIGAAFTTVVTAGIFYSFFGFQAITSFASEIKNPRKNIPLSLILCISIGLVIYLLLQVAFICATPLNLVVHGWHNIKFNSPLVELLMLFNINYWVVILFADAAISPSGTGITYIGSASRVVTGMSRDKQLPQYLKKMNDKSRVSRRSLIFCILLCCIFVLFFRGWDKIIIASSVLQLITCAAIPITFVKLRKIDHHKKRSFRLIFGKTIAWLTFVLVSYLIIQSGFKGLIFALFINVFLFFIYLVCFYKLNLIKLKNALLSSWSIFLYIIIMCVFGYLQEIKMLYSTYAIVGFCIITTILYLLMINQKKYSEEDIVIK